MYPAAVREERAVPRHEAVEPPEFFDQLFARPKREVVGVAEEHLAAGCARVVGRHGFERAVSADGHEGRRLNRAVGRRHFPRARADRSAFEFELQGRR